MTATIPYTRGPAITPMIYCDRHGTITAVDTAPMRPTPPADQVCSVCIREKRGELDEIASGTETVFKSASLDDYSMSPKLRRILDERIAREVAAGRVLPGSQEELDAVESMSAASRQAALDDHAPKGRRRRRGYVPPAYRDAQFA